MNTKKKIFPVKSSGITRVICGMLLLSFASLLSTPSAFAQVPPAKTSAELDKLKSEITTLQQQVKQSEEDARSIMQSYEKSLASKEKKIEDLSKQMSDPNAKATPEQVRELNLLKAQNETLKLQAAKEKAQFAKERDRLVGTLDAQVRLRVEAEEGRNKLISTQQQKIDEVKRQEQSKLMETQKKLDDQIKSRLAAEQESITLQTSLKQQLQTSDEKLTALTAQVERLKTKMNAPSPAPEPAAADAKLKAEMAKIKAQAQSLSANLNRKQAELTKEQNANKALTKQIEDLKTSMAEKPKPQATPPSASEKAEIARLNKAVTDAQKKNIQSRDNHQKEVLRLQTELSQLREAKIAELPPGWEDPSLLKTELAKTKSELKKSASRLASLSKEYDYAKELLNGMNDTNEQVVDLAIELTATKEMNKSLRQQVDLQAASLEELKVQNNELVEAEKSNVAKLTQALEKNKEYLGETSKLKEEVEIISRSSSEVKQELTNARRRLEELQNQLISTEKKLLEVQNEARRKQTELSSIRSIISSLETSNQVMEVEMDIAKKNAAKNAAELSQLISEKEETDYKKNIEISNLQKVVHSNELTIVELKTKLAKSGDQIRLLSELVDEGKENQVKLATLQQKLLQAEEEIAILRPFKDGNEEVQKELANLRGEKASLIKEKNTLLSNLQDEKNNVAKAVKEANDARTEQISNNKVQLERLLALESTNATQAVTLDEKVKLNTELEEQIAIITKQMSDLRSQYDEVETKANQLDKTNIAIDGENRSLEDSLKRSELRVKQIERERDALKQSETAFKDKSNQLEDELMEFRLVNQELSQSISNHFATVEQLDRERSVKDRLQIDLAISRKDNAELKQQVEKTRADVTLAMQAKINSLKDEFERSQTDFRKAETQYQNETRKLIAKTTDLEKRLENSQGVVKLLRDNGTAAEADLIKVQAQIQGMAPLQAQLKGMQKELNEVKSAKLELESQNRDLSQENMEGENLGISIQRIERARDDLDRQVVDLRKQLAVSEGKRIEVQDKNRTLATDLREKENQVLELWQKQHLLLGRVKALLGTDPLSNSKNNLSSPPAKSSGVTP